METKEQVLEELNSIKKSIENESVSYGELAYLESHKQDILELGDIVLAQWGGISEVEWKAGKLRSDRELFETIEELLKQSVAEDYIHEIALAIFKDVKEDVFTSADVIYSDYDVKLAIGRTLMNKYNLWGANLDELEKVIED